MAKDEKGAKQKIKKTLIGCCKALKFLLTPSLVTYFAQSGGIYIVNGLYTWMTMSQIQSILCQIPGEWNETLGHTVGCSNCTDNLLMCGKGWCYKAAMNISIITKNSGSRKSWVDMFLQATQDKECNLKISEANDPIAALDAIISQRAATPGSPGEKCLQWNCQVALLAALTDTDLSSTSGVCTNKKLTKPGYYEKTCVCNTMPMSFTTATKIADACGPQAVTLPSRVFQLAVVKKNTCFQSSLNPGASALLPLQYAKTSKIPQCADWLQNADNHHQWFKSLASGTAGKNAGALENTYAPCTQLFCQAFALAIMPGTAATCNWNTAVYEGFQLSAAQDIYSACNKASAQPLILFNADVIGLRICNISTFPIICGEETTNCPGVTFTQLLPYLGSVDDIKVACAAATAALAAPAGDGDGDGDGGGASVRRLSGAARSARKTPRDSPETSYVDLPVACDDGATGAEAPPSVSFKDLLEGLERPTGKDATDWQPQRESSEFYDDPDGYRFQNVGDGDEPLNDGEESAAARLLQDGDADGDAAAASGGSANDNLLDYTASAWTQCVCYQQCAMGAKTRDVQCKSDKCKSPKPVGVEQCLCTHCADCQVAFNLMGLWLTLFLQGGAGLLLFGAFYFASQISEDDLATFACCALRTPLGLICKVVPVMLRIFVYINMLQVVYLAIQAFIPLPGLMQYDCKTNTPLLILSSVNLALWAGQLCYGIFMKKKKPMPAQLHVGGSSGRIGKIFCGPLRSIGP